MEKTNNFKEKKKLLHLNFKKKEKKKKDEAGKFIFIIYKIN